MSEQQSPTRPEQWRGLDELADTPEFRDYLAGEFPQVAAHMPDEVPDRRRFLQLMGASLALGGMVGCRRPVLEILPYREKPPSVTPGLPTFYATTMPRLGGGMPILVETHQGRPTKIEGHPDYERTKGKTDTFAQASILDLYDPDRSREVLREGKPSSWIAFDAFARKHFEDADRLGDGLRFLCEDVPSPALWMLREQLPKAVWHTYEPLGTGNVGEGTRLAFGSALVPEYHLDKADVILSLDADFLGLDEEAVAHTRGFAARRDSRNPDNGALNRLYVVEDALTVTGARADNRLRLRSSRVPAFAVALARALLARKGVNPVGKIKEVLDAAPAAEKYPEGWIDAVVADLAPGGGSVIVAGPRQPAMVHAVVHVLNEALGSVGKSVFYREPPAPRGLSLGELAKAIDFGKVDTLVVLGGNPVYDTPADLDFAAKLKKVKHSIRLGLYDDETATACTWQLPMSHYLEAWGDCQLADVTYAVQQPMIEPIHFEMKTGKPKTRSALELLAGWTKKYRDVKALDLVRESFSRHSDKSDANAFKKWLHVGFLPGSARKPVEVSAAKAQLTADMVKKAVTPPAGKLEVSFRGDYRVFDGRYVNNSWLQETPDPICKITWDNAALISPKLARDETLKTGDEVTLKAGGRSITLPVFVQPGQADDSITVTLGFGRKEVGRVGKGSGFNVYPLRTSESMWFVGGVELTKTGKTHTIASTQNHGNVTEYSKLADQAKRVDEIARVRTPDQFKTDLENRELDKKHGHHALPLIKQPKFTGQYQWGMVIDLSTCTGCNACQVACQAENNVPVVGKDQILRGREMYWIRLDRYYTGDEGNPRVIHQPVACVHCENAPCETVCPVNAAVHSPEGLNVQVYNRCIGTRYCANNCPYKVRRFNWFDFQQRPLDELYLGPLAPKGKAETLKMGMNPDVTVRMRGVMEKCTYCVQRIERAKIGAKLKDPKAARHPIPDGTVVPACAQVCPASAITFGDLSDTSSRVATLKNDDRHYVLLESIGTKPRTTYLLRLKNPNEKVKDWPPDGAGA